MPKAIGTATDDQAAGAARIRALNDEFRRSFCGGRINVTAGVAALSAPVLKAVIAAVQAFDEFAEDNDPWNEHDMASFAVGDQRFFWKIDYYDRTLRYGSADPADPKVTTRVLTIMLVEEY
jgi:hypothetical protein